MKKNEDGSVTLSKRELAELKKAYTGLCDLIGSFPSSMEDFMDRSAFLNVRKWEAQLKGETFRRSDWE